MPAGLSMRFMRSMITLCAIAIALGGLVACAPDAPAADTASVSGQPADTATEGEVAAQHAAANTEAQGGVEAAATDGAPAAQEETVSGEVQSSDEAQGSVEAQSSVEGTQVDDTATSESEPMAAPPGQSEPGAAEGDAQDAPPAEGAPVAPGEATFYTDSTYGFSIAYPANYLFGAQPAEKLAYLEPKPVAAWIVMNPTLAASDIVDLEPADVEIRVYPSEGAPSLQEWLGAHGFLNEGNLPAQPFHAANASGAEVCASTMIAPGCFYFILGEGWVYQMVPASIEGEGIMSSFTLIQ